MFSRDNRVAKAEYLLLPMDQRRALGQFSKIVLGQRAVKCVKFHPVAGQWTLRCPAPRLRGRLRTAMIPFSYLGSRVRKSYLKVPTILSTIQFPFV